MVAQLDSDSAQTLLNSSKGCALSHEQFSGLQAQIHLHRGAIIEARESFIKTRGDSNVYLAAISALEGHTQAANEEIRKIKTTHLQGDSLPSSQLHLAILFAVTEQQDASLSSLSQAIDLGWRDTNTIECLPFLTSIVALPEWQMLKQRIISALDAERAKILKSDKLQVLVR